MCVSEAARKAARASIPRYPQRSLQLIFLCAEPNSHRRALPSSAVGTLTLSRSEVRFAVAPRKCRRLRRLGKRGDGGGVPIRHRKLCAGANDGGRVVPPR